MKRFNKILAVVIAMVMVLAMAVPAMADPADPPAQEEPAAPKAYDHPIKVTGLTSGDVVHFYQVIEWVGETSDKSDVSGWKAKAPFDTYLDKNKLTEILVGTKDDPATTDVNEAKDATGITSEIAGELAKLASGDGTVVPATSTEVELDNAAAGMWMALVTPKDANTIYNPVFVSADYNKDKAGTVGMGDTYKGDAVAKKSTLTLTKTASTTPEDTNDDQQSTTTAVGDTVTFTVTTAIPAYGDVYDAPRFVLTDNLTAMELKADSENACGYDIVVTGVPATYKDSEGADQNSYTIAPAADKKSYTITFTEGYLKTLKAAVTNVTVVYKAIVTSDAAKAVNEEDNEVKIEYSHNPNKQDDYDVKKDTTQHYTFTLDASGMGEGQSVSGKKTSELVKVGVDANGEPITSKTETSAITNTETWQSPLAGAKFGLFTDSTGETPLKDKDGKAYEATTGDDGRMTFTGLDAGTYYLKEISAPAGFVTNSEVVTVTIEATTKPVHITEWYKDGAWSKTDNGGKKVEYDTDILETYTVKIGDEVLAEYKFKNGTAANSTEIKWDEAEVVEHPHEFKNTQGVELPSTGGMGTTLFYIAGAALALGAGVVLVTRRRMSAH